MKNQANIETICLGLSNGQSLRSIARDMGFTEGALRYWLMTDEHAFTQSARARELGCDALADECLEIADLPGDPADKRIRIDTRIRLIGKWSQRYSDKVTVTSNTTVTHKYDLDSLSNEQLDSLEGILTLAARDTSNEGTTLPAIVH